MTRARVVPASHAAAAAFRTTALLAALLSSATEGGELAAQVNVEALRLELPPPGRSGTVGADVAARAGNVDFVAVDLNVRLYDVRETSTRLMVATGGLGFLERSRFASSGLVHYRATYTEMHRFLQPEWFGQANYDRPILLDFRVVAGAGARGAFRSGTWGDVGGGSSLMVEQEWLALPDTAVHPDRTLALRWSSYLSLRVVASGNTVITSTSYVQPDVTDFGDVRVLETARLSTNISERLALTVSLDMRYDSRPPDGLDALDARLRTGLMYAY